jgi:hypothetical protein
MGLHEVKMTPEEKDAYIASRITDLADSIINIKKYVEMLENKPMVRKDWERCDNTIDHSRDAIMLECHFLSKVLGEPISNSIDKEFRRVFDAGERQGAVICARRMLSKKLPADSITELTGLTADEIAAL